MASGLRFNDKVIIVTGGCSGIGKACVEIFVEQGGKVAVFDIDDEAGNSFNFTGPGRAIYVHCDVCNEQEIQKSLEKTVAEFGKIDCLLNNVGHHPGTFSIDESTVDVFWQLLNVNVVSMFAMSKHTLPYLRKTRGSIINVSSICGTHAQALQCTYCSSKGAVLSLSRALAIDESKYGVRVNSVVPSAINTPLLQRWLGSDEEKRKTVESWSQLGRIGEAREIGLTCLFLATDATFTTGTEIMCTAGCEVGYGVKSDF